MSAIALCRATGAHAWGLVGPIVILKGDARRVVLRCSRCDTWRFDVWSRRHGGLESGRSYKRTDTYAAYLKDHNRDGARMDIMGKAKEIRDESDHPRLRLLRGGRPSRGNKKAS
jgi:hypothetical protein